ncbi:MAG: CBS domain-containing protein [Candidatus Saccharimonadales bacterium]
MLMIILALVLAFVALLAISLLKIYTHVPKIELKRRARQDDEFAKLLYSAAAYGASTQVLLWFFIGLAGAGFFVLASTSLPSWIALLVSLGLVWIGFAWLPNTSTGWLGRATARYATPGFTWLLSHLYPVLDRLAIWFRANARISFHTGLYQKEDLVSLLEKQKHQADNRISQAELSTVEGALTYGDKLIRDVMIPWRMVKTIAAAEAIGPHLMTELHASGHSRFPVYQDKADNLVGMLYARNLIKAHDGGQVKDFMKRDVYYIHEDQTLSQALQAFLKVKHHLFIVVNSFEEKVGIVTLEDVIEQILGKQVVDEFDKYDDLRAVAARMAKVEHGEHGE